MHDRTALEEAERRELFGDGSALPTSVFAALDEEGKSLDRSRSVMHGLLDTARESMNELATQREILKVVWCGVYFAIELCESCVNSWGTVWCGGCPRLSTWQGTQRRVLDMLTTLGVSDATIQSIGESCVCMCAPVMF